MALFARDQFNSATGENLIGRAPDTGAAWVSHPYWGAGAPYVLMDPAGYCQSGSDVFTARLPSAPGNGFGQYDLDGILNTGFGNGVILVAGRCGTDVTGYFVRARENFGSPDLQIERMDAGVFNASGSASRSYTAWASRKVLSIKMEDAGGGALKISALVDGVEELSVTDSSPIAGTGFAVIGGRSSLLYDFAANDTVAGDTTPPTLTSGSATGGTLTGTGGITSNEAGTLYWQVNGSATPLTYPGSGAMSGWTSRSLTVGAQTWSLGSLTAGTYYLHLVADDAVPNRTAADLVLGPFTVSAGGTAPSITTHPGSQSVVAGSTATFTAAASGSPTPTVQWQRNGSDISGATSTSYTTPATTVTGGAANNGDTYRAVFANASGSATSNSATLTVSAAPTAPSITSQPSNQAVTEGAAASFSVTATGTAPLSYQWRRNGTNISGATSSSYTTPATVLADSGALYSVIVSNAAGNVTSNNATLTVNAAGGLAGFDFHAAAGCVFGAISGSLTGLAREVGVSITPYVYSTSTGALVATLATAATNSAGRLPRLTHASLAAGTTYRVTFVWPDGAAYTISMAAS